MGIFNVTIGVSHPDGGDLTEVSAMVDTGALHSVMPERFLEELNIEPLRTLRCRLADDSIREYRMGVALIAINGESFPCPVLFGDGNTYLVGATTLEILGFTVDSIDEVLLRKEPRVRPI